MTGACNLAFLFLVVSGFYLWWPRKWTKSAGRAIVVPERGCAEKRAILTGTMRSAFGPRRFSYSSFSLASLISYPWAGNLLYRLTGSEPPPARAHGSAPWSAERKPRRFPADIDRLWTIAERARS